MRLMKADKQGIAFHEFNAAVGGHHFRGTSRLCRSLKSLFFSISNAMTDRATKPLAQTNQMLTEFVTQRAYKGICLNCRSNKYELNSHSIKIRRDGTSGEPEKPVFESKFTLKINLLSIELFIL